MVDDSRSISHTCLSWIHTHTIWGGSEDDERWGRCLGMIELLDDLYGLWILETMKRKHGDEWNGTIESDDYGWIWLFFFVSTSWVEIGKDRMDVMHFSVNGLGWQGGVFFVLICLPTCGFPRRLRGIHRQNWVYNSMDPSLSCEVFDLTSPNVTFSRS